MQITGSYKLTDKAFGRFAGEQKNLGITEPNWSVSAQSENYDPFVQGVLNWSEHFVFMQAAKKNDYAWEVLLANRASDFSRTASLAALPTQSGRWGRFELNVAVSSAAQYGLSSVESRLDELRRCAQDEGVSINEESLADIRHFITHRGFPEELNIFLLDNGNFRIIWYFTPDKEFGIEFRGGRELKLKTIEHDPISRRVTSE